MHFCIRVLRQCTTGINAALLGYLDIGLIALAQGAARRRPRHASPLGPFAYQDGPWSRRRARPRRPPRMADETAQARGRVLGSREPWPGAEPTRQDCRFKHDARQAGIARAWRRGGGSVPHAEHRVAFQAGDNLMLPRHSDWAGQIDPSPV